MVCRDILGIDPSRGPLALDTKECFRLREHGGLLRLRGLHSGPAAAIFIRILLRLEVV
jgi:hypothetical protein